MPFKKLYIEITNVCNLRCPFCVPSGRAPAFMPARRFEQALKALSGLGGHVYPHVLGEPLLHPELPEILALCGAYGRPVNLATNGLLLDERAEALLGAPALRKLSVSLHAARNEAEALELLDGALRFAERRAGASPYVSLRLWRGDSPAERAVLDELGRRFPGRAYAPRSGHPAWRLAPGLFADLAEPFDWPSGAGAGLRRSCPALRGQLAVLVDGTVVPCCLDARGGLALGNLFETPIAEILTSARAKAIREGFDRGRAVEPLCTGCSGRP